MKAVGFSAGSAARDNRTTRPVVLAPQKPMCVHAAFCGLSKVRGFSGAGLKTSIGAELKPEQERTYENPMGFSGRPLMGPRALGRWPQSPPRCGASSVDQRSRNSSAKTSSSSVARPACSGSLSALASSCEPTDRVARSARSGLGPFRGAASG